MTEQLGSVSELVLRNAKGKIRTTGFGTIRHFFPFMGVGDGSGMLLAALSFRNFRRQRVHVNIP